MTTPIDNSKNQSLFPDVPRESPVVDKEGNFTELWFLGLGDLFQAAQDNFTNEGIVFPQLDATSIAAIATGYQQYVGAPLPQNVPDISGKTLFDATNRVPKVFIITFDEIGRAHV